VHTRVEEWMYQFRSK